MNIACSTTAFTRLPIEDALERISGLGFSHVDLLIMEGWAHADPSRLVSEGKQFSTRIAALLKRNGLHAAAMNCNTSAALSTLDSTAARENALEAEALLAVAEQLSVPVVVFQPGVPSGKEKYRDERDASVGALRGIVSEATRRRTTVAIETHSRSFAEGYDDALGYVAEVPGLKLAYDPSHFVMAGLALEKSSRLIPHTAHVHLRNAVEGNFQAPVASGDLDFMWVLEALDAASYSGAISIEYLDNRDDEILGDITALKRLLETRYSHV